MEYSLENAVLKIKIQGIPTLNPETLKLIISIARTNKLKQVILEGEFVKKLSPHGISLINDYVKRYERIKFVNVDRKTKMFLEHIMDKALEDPYGAYLDLVNSGLKTNPYYKMIKSMFEGTKLIKELKGKNPSEAYLILMEGTSTPAYLDSELVDVKGKIVEKYKLSSCRVNIVDAGEYVYKIVPEETKLDAIEEINLIKALKDIKARDIVFEPEEARVKMYELAEKLTKDEKLAKIIVRHTVGYGLLEHIFSDPKVQDIYIDEHSIPIYVYHEDYEICKTNIVPNSRYLEKIATRLRMNSARPFDDAHPVLHTDIKEYGIRVAAVRPPLTFNSIAFAFRKHRSKPWTLQELVKKGMMDWKVAGLISYLVKSETSILITGARGSGKTSLLGATLFRIPKNQRIIVMEDTKELPIDHLKQNGWNVLHIRTTAELEGETYEKTSEYALRTALRLGESVLVIGEVRGHEAKALFEAMRIGAAGNAVLGTIHGSSAYDTWDRIVNDIGVPSTSFKATDVVIACGYVREKVRSRRVWAITEVRKQWTKDPSKEKGFYNIAEYNAKTKKFNVNLNNSEIIKTLAKKKGKTIPQIKKEIEKEIRQLRSSQ